ncbi:hypothetical protein [Streptomyces sp. NPDC051546]|uniref:hypothetical protein n=1 Tax=Streptomyces sp. NPDC051546 TaxID=3365655 RepID=UPI0037873B8F
MTTSGAGGTPDAVGGADAVGGPADGVEPLAWCLVANVGRETAHGDGGLEIRDGLRHFSPGALVWLTPPMWGDGGERMRATGRRRKNRWHHLSVVVPTRHLENFRVKGVYGPALLTALEGTRTSGPGARTYPLWASREQAQQMADALAEHRVEVRVRGAHALPEYPYGIQFPPVGDPPPMELEHGGHTFYLARFNARRAVYSHLPPPAEPPAGPETP